MKNSLIDRLLLAVNELGDDNIFLVSDKGEIYLSAVDSIEDLADITIACINKSVKDRRVIFTDFYYCSKEDQIHFSTRG